MSIENNELPQNPSIESETVRPFRRFCTTIMTIGSLPSSYQEAMSYQEMLLWLCDFIENKVIPAFDNNANAIKELQNLYIELKSYVDNYFTNLDIQTEINNKLDEMVLDGTLEELLSKFLNFFNLKTYTTVNEMITDFTLIKNNKCICFNYNDNDGAINHFIISDTESENNLSIKLNNDLYAIKIDKIGYVSNYGAKKNEDITEIIKLMINLNIQYIIIDVDCSISEFTITKPITLDAQNHIIKLTKSQGSTADCLITNNSTVTFKNIIFDGQNQFAYGCIKNVNTYNCIIENCTFQNFKLTNQTLQLNVIHVHKGSSTIINKCYFKNIKTVGNGTATDNGGTGSCIRTYDGTETENITNLIIDKCVFENNYNINEQDEFIMEDFDNIHIQNTGENNITISNILSIDSGKRVVKCQGSNVNINNITSINNNTNAQSLIACFADNITISNCYSKNKSIVDGIEIGEANNINISNINIIDNGTSHSASYSSPIIIQKASNVNINNFNGSGFADNVRIWDTSNNINFSNCSFINSLNSILDISTRTASSSSIESGINIKNIRFNDCYFHSKCATETRILNINETNSNTIENIKFTNCDFKIDFTNYIYGIIRDNSKYSDYINCNFDITNTKDNIYTLTFERGIKHVSNCHISTTNNTPSFRVAGTSRLYIDNIIAPNVSCNFTGTGKAVLNYCNFRELVGNTETNCKNNSFDMS